MSRKTLIWLLFFSIILNISTIVTFGYYRWFHQDWHSSSKRDYSRDKDSDRRKSFESRLAKKLNLSEQQIEQMRELRSEFFKGFKPLMEGLREQRQQFSELMKNDSLDTLHINEKIESIAELQKQIQFYSMKNLLKHRAVLDDEQWSKFKSIFARMMIGDDRRRGRHSDSDHPPKDSKSRPDSAQKSEPQ